VAQHLLRFAGLKVAPATVGRALQRAGVKAVPPARRPRRAPPQPRRFERARPNQLWQTDITSFVLPRPSARVYLTVFLDDHSRYVVSWALASHQKGELVLEALRDGVGRFGKPEEVLSDQGRQYFAWRGKSLFQRELKRLGIAHVVARSHHPQTVGKCERLWKTIQDELLSRCAPLDLAEARERLGHFFAHYNHLRPHQGLAGAVPADRFFGAEDQVRARLQANLADNELALAIGEAPRQPVYLVGQVGEHAVSVHGERGRLVVVTPSGTQELSFDELGAASSAPQLEAMSDDEQCDHDRGAAADATERQATALSPSAAGAAGAGAVGGGERGGAGEGAQDSHRDPGVVDGSQEQGSGGERAGADGTACLAIESGGPEWDAGGPAEATQATREGGDEGSLGRQHSGSGGAAQGERGAQAQAGSGGAADRAAAGVSGREGPLAAAGEGGREGGWDRASGEEEDSATGGCEWP
jgi:transposase InsO family protein